MSEKIIHNYVPLIVSPEDLIVLAKVVGGIWLTPRERSIADERIEEIATGTGLGLLERVWRNNTVDSLETTGDISSIVDHPSATP